MFSTLLRFLGRTVLVMVSIAGLIVWVGTGAWGWWWAVVLGLAGCGFLARRLRPPEPFAPEYPSYRNTDSVLVDGVRVTDTTQLMAPYEEIARKLAHLVRTAEVQFPALTKEQQRVLLDRFQLERQLRDGVAPELWVRDSVEIRSLGHELNASGGFGLMLRVFQRAAELSDRPEVTSVWIDRTWAGIGEWS
ncbi:hypothetical protein [Kribbella sp. CA-294648]|uniref:hypothetical protein n=1 Tax=Kribbella sp. CA-294648 TaxID=3239948 RepID=UPI003D8CD263